MSATAPPSRADVEDRFVSLLSGSRTRDEVDRWASRWVVAEESEVPDKHVWWALTLLCGIDLRHGPGEPYLHDDQQVSGWLDEFRDRCANSA
jgi:hypothetical protein